MTISKKYVIMYVKKGGSYEGKNNTAYFRGQKEYI